MADTGQIDLLKLHFHFWSDHDLRRGSYEFLRVEYLNNARPAENYPLRLLYQRPPQYRWEIVVQPVPRINRHKVKQYLEVEVLPIVKEWLNSRRDLNQQGSDILAFFYDEKTEQFQARSVTRLEPARQ